MKKVLSLLISFVLLLALVSCAADVSSDNLQDNIGEESEEIYDVNAALLWYDYSDAFLSTVREDLSEKFGHLGVEDTNYDAGNNQETQNTQIDTAISEGANLLIVNIVDTASVEAAQSVVDKASTADIPVIFFDREVDDVVINSYDNACFVGTRSIEASEQQGKMMGNYILDNYAEIDLDGDGFISYIMLEGQFSDTEPERSPDIAVENCDDILKTAGKPAMVYYNMEKKDEFHASGWSKSDAFEVMEAALAEVPMDSEEPIELVVTNNDDQALGCVEALNAVGWNTGEGSLIPVFGVDYTADAAEAIESGKMAGSVMESTEGLVETITELTRNVMHGKNVFEGAKDQYYVDEAAAKILVPFEIKVTDVKPEKIEPKVPEIRIVWDDFDDMATKKIAYDIGEEVVQNGMNSITHDCQASQEAQKNVVDTAISEGVDLIVICMEDPTDNAAAQYIVDSARAADIPIIFVVRAIDDSVMATYDKVMFAGKNPSGVGVVEKIMDALDID